MEWVEQFNQAIALLETVLPGPVEIGRLAQAAGCSAFHFQRLFAYLAGMPLSEYIRRRRMSLAAADLQAGARVLDVALRCGYASPTAFNRAFRQVHGIPPSQARLPGAPLRSYPPIRLQIAVQGGTVLEFRVEKREAFPILGLSFPLRSHIEENFRIVPQMWEQAVAEGTLARLAAQMDGTPQGLLGVSLCQDSQPWRYYIAVASSQPPGPWEAYTVPASTWAIFPGRGPASGIQQLERRIITEWLPTSGYEYADAPDLEVYQNPDPRDAQYEIWIPVAPKP